MLQCSGIIWWMFYNAIKQEGYIVAKKKTRMKKKESKMIKSVDVNRLFIPRLLIIVLNYRTTLWPRLKRRLLFFPFAVY